MAWECEHSAHSDASPEAIWERYVDVENWREWAEKGVEESSIEGEFEVGTKGVTKAPNLPRTRFELVAVEPERRFASKTRVPGGTMLFEHELEPSDGGTRITHRATLDGRLASLWTPLLGRLIEREMPEGVERLAELAVEKEEMKRKEAEEEKEREAKHKEADEEFKRELEKTSRGEGNQGGASVPGT